jgi:putative ABC transport system substrate-binding protein
VELLKEIMPRVGRIAMLFNPASAPYIEYWLSPFKATAARLAVEAISAPVRDVSELDSVIAAQAREPNSGLIAMPESFTIAYRTEIISLADRYRLPGQNENPPCLGSCQLSPATDIRQREGWSV